MSYKVKFKNKASGAQINWGGCDNPNDLLKIDQEYEVEEIDVHSYHTKLKLVGIEGWFNDVTFSYNIEPNKQAIYEAKRLEDNENGFLH